MRPSRNKPHFKFASKVNRFRAIIIKQNAPVVSLMPTSFRALYPAQLHSCIPIRQSRERASSCVILKKENRQFPRRFPCPSRIQICDFTGTSICEAIISTVLVTTEIQGGKMMCPCKMRYLDTFFVLSPLLGPHVTLTKCQDYLLRLFKVWFVAH